jgi:hypothetical protein
VTHKSIFTLFLPIQQLNSHLSLNTNSSNTNSRSCQRTWATSLTRRRAGMIPFIHPTASYTNPNLLKHLISNETLQLTSSVNEPSNMNISFPRGFPGSFSATPSSSYTSGEGSTPTHSVIIVFIHLNHVPQFRAIQFICIPCPTRTSRIQWDWDSWTKNLSSGTRTQEAACKLRA